jgi:sugar/nucleoside kinase (ribokinase family)
MPDLHGCSDVAGIGLNATDVLIRVPRFPEFNSKIEFLDARTMAGGQTASAMEACQRWGLRARYVGKIGDDSAGEFQRARLAEFGVETHWLAVPGCSSQTAYILVEEDSGERTILWRRDARLEIQPEELRREWVTDARALLVDGHDTRAAATAARWAREAGIPVVLDVDNIYAGLGELLEATDYLIASKEFPTRWTGEPDLRRALLRLRAAHGCRAAGATLGRSGVALWDGAGFHVVPAYRVRAVDTTGAGDIFHGAFVFGLVQGWELERILDFSCAAAALSCTEVGARGGIRPLAEIEALMRCGERYPAAEL